jgi:ADP-ribose pyrophosphatase YjhB (NUDIX family)
MVCSFGRILFCSPVEALTGAHILICGAFGHVEPDETLDDALVRELREEIGVNPTQFRPLCSIVDPNTTVADHVTYHMYLVTTWQGGEPAIIDDEHVELRWFPMRTAMTVPSLALEEYRPLFEGLARSLGLLQ